MSLGTGAAPGAGEAAGPAVGACRPGNRTVNLLPAPGVLSTATEPACSSTSRFTMASPSPVPSPLRPARDWEYGSKMRGRSAGAMPIPSSHTVIVSMPPCAEASTPMRFSRAVNLIAFDSRL